MASPVPSQKRARNENWQLCTKNRAGQSEPQSTMTNIDTIYKTINKHMRIHNQVPRWFEALAHPLSAVQHVNDTDLKPDFPTAFPAAEGWGNGEPRWLDVIEHLSDPACFKVTLAHFPFSLKSSQRTLWKWLTDLIEAQVVCCGSWLHGRACGQSDYRGNKPHTSHRGGHDQHVPENLVADQPSGSPSIFARGCAQGRTDLERYTNVDLDRLPCRSGNVEYFPSRQQLQQSMGALAPHSRQ